MASETGKLYRTAHVLRAWYRNNAQDISVPGSEISTSKIISQ